MSTLTRYDYDAEAARQWANEELMRRQAEAARLRAEQAAAVHRETLALAARQGLINRNLLRQQGIDLSSTATALTALSAQSAADREQVLELAARLHAEHIRLEETRRGAEEEARKLDALIARAGEAAATLKETRQQTEQTLASVAALSTANVEYVSRLASDDADGSKLAAESAALADRCRSAAMELRFISEQAARQPGALVALVTMESNGYRLAQAESRDGLTHYFERDGDRHSVAVRLAAEDSADGPPRWLLDLETFGCEGAECLDVVTEFRDAVEASGRAHMRQQPGRIYPKPPWESKKLEAPPRRTNKPATRTSSSAPSGRRTLKSTNG